MTEKIPNEIMDISDLGKTFLKVPKEKNLKTKLNSSTEFRSLERIFFNNHQ